MAKRTIRRFDAAQINRTMAEWITSQINSFDDEVKRDTPTLRARSRDASINDAYARRYFKVLKNNVVGPTGINLKMVVRDPNGRPDTFANQTIETEWHKFARAVTVDKMNLRELLNLVVETTARDGEVFLVKKRGQEFGPYMFALQVLEAEYCDIKMDGFASNGNTIRSGIEYNSYGVPVAYYFYASDPNAKGGLKTTEKIRLPAEDVMHVYDRERASQGRGFPWLSAGLIALKHLKEYEESELVAARVASAKMGFFTRSEGEGNQLGDEIDPVDPNAMLQSAEPGMFDVLAPGYSLQTFDPQNPNGNFAGFVKTILRSVAASVGIAYNTLASDLESTSYSSLRQGAIDERETFKAYQQWLIERVLTPLFEEWLQMLLAFRINGVRLPLERFDKFNAPSWRPRSWQFIDVQKETAAIKMALDENIRSRTDVVRQMGYDYVDVLQEIADEQAMAQQMGVVIEPTQEASKTNLMDGSFMEDENSVMDDEEDSQEDSNNNRE